jgi:hypothetical protein
MNPGQAPGGYYPPPAWPPPPTPPAVPVQRPDKWEEWWTLKLPAWLDDWFPQAANALADGAWTAAWRGVAAVAPALAFAVGLLSRLIFRDLNAVFSESLVFIAIVIAGALLSGPVGAMLFVGYIVQDVALGNRVDTLSGLDGLSALNLVGLVGGKLVSYLLLAIPAITVPLLANQLTQGVKLRQFDDPNQRLWSQAALYGTICAVLIYLWTQSMIVLIRPFFTWLGTVPTVAAIYPVQQQTFMLVGIALLAGAGRVLLEQGPASRSPRAAVVALLKRERWTGAHAAPLSAVPQAIRVAIASAVVTLVLAGTYEDWVDGILVAVITGLIGMWRAGLIRLIPVPAGWALRVRRYPPLTRLLAASAIGYALTGLTLIPFWLNLETASFTQGLRPVLLGALLTLVAFHILFPPLPVAKGPDPNQQGRVYR